jgi:arylsulfatase A
MKYRGKSIIFFMQTVSVGAWVLVNSFVVHAQKEKPSRPNVIYIFADDLGYGELGSYGQKKIRTPHLDQLAAEGMRFTQHYSGTPVCAPSRYNLMTGLHAGHSLIRNNGGGKEDEDGPKASALPDSTTTIATLFKKAGYSTAAIGKWGLGNQNSSGSPLRHGFDRFYGFYSQTLAHNHYPDHLYNNDEKQLLSNQPLDVHPKLKKNEVQPADVEKYKGTDYATDRMTDNAIDFIDDHQKKPFFLYLAYTLPHVALQAPEADIEYYKKVFNEQPQLYLRGYVPTYYPKSTYAAMITYLDKQVGIVMELLKKKGLDKNTIILFCSDNGPAQLNSDDGSFFNSTAGLRGIKRDLYEGGIREPFIVKWPGKIKAGTVSHHLSATYDMMATFGDLLKVPAPVNDGVSILPTLLSNTKQHQHEFLYWEFPEKGGQVAVRMGKWKGIKVGLKKQKEPTWQLYDLDADRNEANDVASKHPEVLRRLDEVVKKEHTPSVRKEWDF